MPAGTRNWGHRDGPQHRQPIRRKTSVLQEEEGAGGGAGSQTQPPGPGVPPVGAVGVWKAAGGRGTRETGEGAEGPDAAGGCLADIQRQYGYVFWIFQCSLDCTY